MKTKVFTATLLLLLTFSTYKTTYSNIIPNADIPIINTANVGYNIKRTMHLLESSTPKHRNTVKILFYGQSIITSNNQWTAYLINWLRDRYPYANIQPKNLAISGYKSEKLSRMVEDDLKAYYPDLVILYDKGTFETYEQLVKWIRQNTTAEILLFTHHYIGEDIESDHASHDFLPNLAKKYDAELCQIRDAWKTYVNEKLNGNPGALLRDERHLNLEGQEFMFNLVKQHFVYRPSPSFHQVKDYTVGKDVFWKNGRLKLPFKGNRVEAIAALGKPYTAKVFIDGKRPSQTLACYYNTRILSKNGNTFNRESGHLLKAKLLKIPKTKEWRLIIKSFKPANPANQFTFQIKGYKNGSSATTYKTTHWEIDPRDFCLSPKTRNGTLFQWKVLLAGNDQYVKPTNLSRNLETTTILASGLSNAQHVLTLRATDPKRQPAIKTLRIYTPK